MTIVADSQSVDLELTEALKKEQEVNASLREELVQAKSEKESLQKRIEFLNALVADHKQDQRTIERSYKDLMESHQKMCDRVVDEAYTNDRQRERKMMFVNMFIAAMFSKSRIKRRFKRWWRR